MACEDDVILGNEILLKRGNGAATEVFTEVAKVGNISGPNLKADTKEITPRGTKWKEFKKLLRDGGEVKFDIYQFIIDEETHSISSGLLHDFVTDDCKRNYQLVIPTTPVTTWMIPSLVTGLDFKMDQNDDFMGSVTLKVSGEPDLGQL